MKYLALVMILASLLAASAQAGEKETASDKSTKDSGGSSIG